MDAGAAYDLAVLYNGLARYDVALDAAHKAAEFDDVVTSSWSLYELVEAASHWCEPVGLSPVRGSSSRRQSGGEADG